MAVRGGIVDVFPPTEEHPLRVEFWGEVVEEVRWFSVADQRSLEVAAQGLWAPPCREILLTDAVRARAAALTDRLPGVADLLTKIAAGIAVPVGRFQRDADLRPVASRRRDLHADAEEALQKQGGIDRVRR